MRTNKFTKLLLFICCTLTFAACDDEDGIYFTQDEVIQGDILTGKQIGLKNNTLNIYTTEGGGVNVQGSKGAISATSSDDKIATATCQNEETKSVQVKAHAVGNTFITVTDAKGNSQRFTVVVKDVEELWSQKSVSTVKGAKQCVVTGATRADSAAIAVHAIANDKDYKYVYKTRSYIPFGDVIFRLDVFDKDDNRILSGPVHEKTSNEQIEIFSADYSTVIMTYYKRNLEGATYLVKDLTKEYQATYPTVTKVELFIQTLLIQ